jgi:hypothetical protein
MLFSNHLATSLLVADSPGVRDVSLAEENVDFEMLRA